MKLRQPQPDYPPRTKTADQTHITPTGLELGKSNHIKTASELPVRKKI